MGILHSMVRTKSVHCGFPLRLFDLSTRQLGIHRELGQIDRLTMAMNWAFERISRVSISYL